MLLPKSLLAALSLLPTLLLADDKHTESQQHKEHAHLSEHNAQDEHHAHSAHGHDHENHTQELERIQVTASRLGRIAIESATRTEIINGEEIQEKAIMRPGNISMLVAETGGVRVQTTAPALGNANIRLQSLYGRYTQLLSDGLPLYGGQVASIGLLQIPPTDLASVEIIKGSASSLYGGSALGGVINLISRTPKDKFEGEVLLNATSKNGQDITSYVAAPLSESYSGSLTAGLHHQQNQDFDDDGWIDMAGYERGSLRPRLYWQNDSGANLYLTLGVMSEQRTGGTLPGATLPNGESFAQNLDSDRTDIGFVFDRPFSDTLNLNLRGSAMRQEHQHQFGVLTERDRHESFLLESSVSGYSDDLAWVTGVAIQSEHFHSDTFGEFDFSYQVPGLFSQVDYELAEQTSVSVSARHDWHSEYGNQFSPRISFLYQPENWVIRGAYGRGYYAPTPFIEDIDETGLSRLLPLEKLEVEQATTRSIDVSYFIGALESSVTLFDSTLNNVTELQSIDANGIAMAKTTRLVNDDQAHQIRGAELLLRYRWRDIKVTGSYLYADARKSPTANHAAQPIALTPKHSAGLVIMWEEHGSHVVGFEAYYTGSQHLENNPYRDKSKPYWHLGLLAQITIGQISWFANAENLLDVRQTKDDPLLLPEQADNGRWTTDVWSRNDGFIVNAGMRFSF